MHLLCKIIANHFFNVVLHANLSQILCRRKTNDSVKSWSTHYRTEFPFFVGKICSYHILMSGAPQAAIFVCKKTKSSHKFANIYYHTTVLRRRRGFLRMESSIERSFSAVMPVPMPLYYQIGFQLIRSPVSLLLSECSILLKF